MDFHDEMKDAVQIVNQVKRYDYNPIKQSQIDWFSCTSQALREERQESYQTGFHTSVVLQHISLPEFGDEDLFIKSGQ